MDTHTAVGRPLSQYRVVELKAMGTLPGYRQEMERLTLILAPATRVEILKTVRTLMTQFQVVLPNNPRDEEDLMNGYVLAMEGYPVWAIIETSRAFIRGEVEGAGDFMPKPATIGRELMRRVDDYRSKLQRVSRKMSEWEPVNREGYGPRSPESKALGDAYLARAKARRDAERQALQSKHIPEWVDPNPLTEEMLKDVPDAPSRGAGMAKAPLPEAFKDLKRNRA